MNIQWNKVTWYSKLIALVLFVALPFIGFYYGVQYGKLKASIGQETVAAITSPAITNNSTDAGATYYSNPAEWQVDANNTAGAFSIAYPIDFNYADNYPATPSTDWRVNANNVTGIKYFTLTIPSAFEPQTNLADATLTVGGSKNSAAIAECLTPDQSGGPATATSSVTIDGIPFVLSTFNSAGAGNLYATASYRTIHAGECYAIEYTIHSSQIANYPSSYNLQPFDASKISSLMQTIINTFKFQ